MAPVKSPDQKSPPDSRNSDQRPSGGVFPAERHQGWISAAERDPKGRDADESVKWDEV
jgi:hypothetical protein